MAVIDLAVCLTDWMSESCWLPIFIADGMSYNSLENSSFFVGASVTQAEEWNKCMR